MSDRKYILSAEAAGRKLQRMAYEIAERNTGVSSLVLAGVHENGMHIAVLLRHMLEKIGLTADLLEIQLDKRHPGAIRLSKDLPIDGQTIILVDDVANSGKTLIYALKPFLEKHPAGLQTLVLVDRAHKAFPVQADYIGLSLSTTLQEHIFVGVENGRVTGAWLE
ncbi:MAG TPA: phosphoribosyltransferase family protein [Dinghuibacter sp.]|uniref:phosphoribosyltransferase family protein n=1 Tax=Dinghuibacter sp. TaxID=2024697 RepID=UPI002BCD5EBC|nr:phosphoribosyltransferase family protein [Dinghuibacter sp.]HTJ15132.1 phosphoribosyltransferase family protein [Dinghuibacter sp.]